MKLILPLILIIFCSLFSANAQPPTQTLPELSDSMKAISASINQPLFKKSIVPKNLPLRKVFPNDTVAKFIKKYGNDSLINLINQRIALSETYLIQNIYNQKDNVSLMESVFLMKHFKLKADLIHLEQDITTKPLSTLYGSVSGDTSQINAFLTSAEGGDINLADSIVGSIYDSYVQTVLSIFIDRVAKDAKSFNKVAKSLYDYSILRDNEYSVGTYVKLVEMYKRNRFNTEDSVNYQKKMFKKLYANNNLKSSFLDVKFNLVKQKPEAVDSMNALPVSINPINDDFIKYSKEHNPLRLLAYALYADDINLQKYPENLMYLLDAQKKDGSWSVAMKYNAYYQEVSSTIYGLWSLCEFKEKLSDK